MMEMGGFPHYPRLIYMDTDEEAEHCNGVLWLAVSRCITHIRTKCW